MSHPSPKERLRQAYERWSESKAADFQGFLELFADEVEFCSIGETQEELGFARRRRGRAEMEQYFATVNDDWKMAHFVIDRFVAEGDTVVMIGKCGWVCRETGKRVETPKVDVWRFEAGQAVEVLEMYDSAAARDAATGG